MAAEKDPHMSEPNSANATFEKLVSGRGRVVTDSETPDEKVIASNMVDPARVDLTDLSVIGLRDFELVKVCEVPFTKETAAWIMTANEVPGERPRRTNHVRDMLTTFVRRTYLPELGQLAVCQLVEPHKDPITFRVDGQHRCVARLQLKDDTFSPKVRLFLYRASSMDGVKALYSQIDRGAQRTPMNVRESFLVDVPPFNAYGRETRNLLGSSLSLYLRRREKDRANVDPEVLVSLMVGSYMDAAVASADLLRGAGKTLPKHMARTPVVAAMIGSYLASPKGFKDFWTPIRDGVGLVDLNDPRLRLRNDLMSNAVGSANKMRKADKSIGAEAMFRMCILAWNAFREGRPLARLTVGKSADRPAFHK